MPASATTSADDSLDASAPSTGLPTATKLIIGLLLGSTFVVILNETLMGVAIPTLIESLGITASLAQWLTTAFMLTLAVVIPITGYLLQRFQTRPMFLLAMSLFTIGTVILHLQRL